MEGPQVRFTLTLSVTVDLHAWALAEGVELSAALDGAVESVGRSLLAGALDQASAEQTFEVAGLAELDNDPVDASAPKYRHGFSRLCTCGHAERTRMVVEGVADPEVLLFNSCQRCGANHATQIKPAMWRKI